ncbi:MAG: hypothetical protein IJY67_03975 [Paludibacteraceae bacterium]|nr:hypothetical protein [Paludibacteraceae bacterium]MBQ8721290.1 hypothetical protein [Paludibacteraceae bacterium]
MKKFTFFFAALLISMTAFADYYVAGTSALCGSTWSCDDANNKMTLTDGVYVKLYANVPAGSHEFKVTNGTWDVSKGYGNVDATTSTPGYGDNNGNITFTLQSATNITISYNETTDKVTLKAEGLDKFGEFVITSYSIVGNFPCFGGDWSPENTGNNMVEGSNGVWTKSYENVALEAKAYEYKVAANNTWGKGEYPSGNQKYEVQVAGVYNIVFTYNPATPELTCEATLVGEVEQPEPTVIPNGTQLYLNPSAEWKESDARFVAYFFGGDGELWLDMTDSNGDGIYEVVSQGTREKVIFCRMNPETTENNWDNKWNQTSDLTYDGVNNQYNVVGWEEGNWSIYENSENVKLDDIISGNVYGCNGMIVADEEISIFTITGQNVTNRNGNLETGVYIVKSANMITKVILK